jgi:hypothetical protein
LTDSLNVSDLGDFIKNNIFFMKDAYFEKQWVYSTGSSLNIHKIVNKLFT